MRRLAAFLLASLLGALGLGAKTWPVPDGPDAALNTWRGDINRSLHALPSSYAEGAEGYRESARFEGGSATSLVLWYQLPEAIDETAPLGQDNDQFKRAQQWCFYLGNAHPDRVRDPEAPTDESRRRWMPVRDTSQG